MILNELQFGSQTVNLWYTEYITNIFSNYDNENTVIITDSIVGSFYSSYIKDFRTITLPVGEEAKCKDTLLHIYDKFLEFNVDRNTVICGLGGGCICDVSAYAASTYMRGTKLDLVPTTVIAQADAAIGGKTAINYKKIRNLIGSFYLPDNIYICAGFFDTLPEKHYISGLAEIIKIAVVANKELFAHLENAAGMLKLRDNKVLEEVIKLAINEKYAIVKHDFTDKSRRKILNFGHTIAHGLESNYKLFHGDAVAIGMIAEAKISLNNQTITNIEFQRIYNLLVKMQLPVSFDYDYSTVENSIKSDKKKHLNSIDMIAIHGIGSSKIITYPISELKNIL